MCCFVLGLMALGPRFGVLFIWIFGSRVDNAFGSWIWPLLGVIFLPWTTLMYILAWGPINGVSGGGWILVGIGVALDLFTYSARSAKNRYRTVY